MANYPANKIFPTKVKKYIFWSYVQNVVVNGWQYQDIAGKPFSQINMLGLWHRCLFQMCVYVESESKLMDETGFNYEAADVDELCDFILANEELFKDKVYGGVESEKVIDFIPKYQEIMNILRSGEVYKGLKMS